MKVVVTDCNFASFEQEQIVCDRNGFNLEIHQCKTPEEVLAVSADADALLVQYAPVTADVLKGLKNCKMIVRYGIGVDTIDLEAAKENGIAICNVPDYGIEEVADHAAALTLALARQTSYFDNSIREQSWPATPRIPMHSFAEMRFTVIGAGRIGRCTLDRMRAFGFKLGAYDPFVSTEDLKAIGVEKMELDQAFSESDIISLHMPLIEETHHLVDMERMKTMKPTSILINTSRGGLINTKELAEALKNGEIGHAGIDVFESEPMEADHPLRECRNALLTPHMAYYSEESIIRLQQYAAEEVERALKGESLRCQVA